MALTSAMEDYLEAVFMLQKQNGYVRCVDVAERLGVKKPSVSRAVRELSQSGHLVKNADGTLSLTETGLQLAEQIYEKHCFLRNSLSQQGWTPKSRSRTPAALNMQLVQNPFRN